MGGDYGKREGLLSPTQHEQRATERRARRDWLGRVGTERQRGGSCLADRQELTGVRGALVGPVETHEPPDHGSRDALGGLRGEPGERVAAADLHRLPPAVGFLGDDGVRGVASQGERAVGGLGEALVERALRGHEGQEASELLLPEPVIPTRRGHGGMELEPSLDLGGVELIPQVPFIVLREL